MMDDSREFIITERNKDVYGFGWIPFYRGLMKDPNIWRWEIDHPERRSKGFIRVQAILWLLGNAVFKPQAIPIEGHYIKLDKGDLLTSELKMMESFGWSKKKLYVFLGYLEEVGEIKRETIRFGRGATKISMLNYKKYLLGETITETNKKQDITRQDRNWETERETDNSFDYETQTEPTQDTLGDTHINNVYNNDLNNGLKNASDVLSDHPGGHKLGKWYGYDDLMNVWLTDDDYKRLEDTYGEDYLIDAIEGVSLLHDECDDTWKERYYAHCKVVEAYIKNNADYQESQEKKQKALYDGKYHNVSYSLEIYKMALDQLLKESNFIALIDKISIERNKMGKGKGDITEDIKEFLIELESHPEKFRELVY